MEFSGISNHTVGYKEKAEKSVTKRTETVNG